MPKWKKDEKEFTIRVTYHETRGYQTYLPRPIMRMLGSPDTVKLVVKNKRIEFQRG